MLAGAVAAPAIAERPQPLERVAVLVFEGRGGAVAEEDVTEAVSVHFAVVDGLRFASVARRLRRKRLRDRDIATVSRRLGVVAVIEGRVERDVLVLDVREGATGEVVKRYRIPVSRGAVSKGNRRRLARELDALIGGFEEVRRQIPRRKRGAEGSATGAAKDASDDS